MKMYSNLCLVEPIELDQSPGKRRLGKDDSFGSWSAAAIVLPGITFSIGSLFASGSGVATLSHLLFYFWASVGVWFLTALLSSANNESTKNMAWTVFPTLLFFYFTVL